MIPITKVFVPHGSGNEKEVIEILKDANLDDSTFNLAGKESVEAGIKAGIIDKSCVMTIQGIPYALSLL